MISNVHFISVYDLMTVVHYTEENVMQISYSYKPLERWSTAVGTTYKLTSLISAKRNSAM